MRVRRQAAIDEVNSPAIEELAAGRDSYEHRRATVLGDANGRGSLRPSSRHVLHLRGRAAQLMPLPTLRPDNK
jgi:hypothetical protein